MSHAGPVYSWMRREEFERQREVSCAYVVLSDSSRIHSRTTHPQNTGCRVVFRHISVHRRHTEISHACCNRRRLNAHPLPLAAERDVRSAVVPFRPKSSGSVLTGIVDMPLPSSKCFPHPASSPTRKCTLRCSVPRTVSNVESQGYISLRADLNHRPPTKRSRNNSLLFELCAEIVIRQSESGEKEKVRNTTSSSPTCQTRSGSGRL